MQKPGRNDPCPCGSGKKYKQCCLTTDAASPESPPFPTPTPKPHHPDPAQLTLLADLFNSGRHAEMETLGQNLTRQYPDSGQSWKALGTAMQVQGKDALDVLSKAAQLLPADAEVHNNLAAALLDRGQALDAIDAARQALALRPDYAEAHANLGKATLQLKRLAEAADNYERAIALQSRDPSWHCNLGVAYKELGRLHDAEAAFDRALALAPGMIQAHYGLSLLKTYREHDPHPAMLETRINAAGALPPQLAIRYWFALGKMREDLGRYDDAFAAYREGNRIKHEQHKTEDTFNDALVDRIKSTFDRELFAARDGLGHIASKQTPVFIVGMPRSGTSLLEQILASCPGVFGAGELPLMHEIVEEQFRGKTTLPFPLAVPALTGEQLAQMGRQYTERAWYMAPDAHLLTDKMPANFFYVGLIRLMLPQAKIIHIMRDPMDTCFSCYSLLFNGDTQAFSYDLEALGHYYTRYAMLMAHWHAVMPDAILALRYEDLVQNTEAEARRVLDFIGLPWDERCLDFHRNPRRVETASAAQVKRPIYTSSVKRWQRFAQHLEPLSQLIEKAGSPV